MKETSSSTPRLKQCIAPFVFGCNFSHTEGIPIAPGFFITFRGGLILDDTCRIAAEIGFKGYDLMGPQHWPTLTKYGLTPTMSHLGSAGLKLRVGAKHVAGWNIEQVDFATEPVVRVIAAERACSRTVMRDGTSSAKPEIRPG